MFQNLFHFLLVHHFLQPVAQELSFPLQPLHLCYQIIIRPLQLLVSDARIIGWYGCDGRQGTHNVKLSCPGRGLPRVGGKIGQNYFYLFFKIRNRAAPELLPLRARGRAAARARRADRGRAGRRRFTPKTGSKKFTS